MAEIIYGKCPVCGESCNAEIVREVFGGTIFSIAKCMKCFSSSRQAQWYDVSPDQDCELCSKGLRAEHTMDNVTYVREVKIKAHIQHTAHVEFAPDKGNRTDRRNIHTYHVEPRLIKFCPMCGSKLDGEVAGDNGVRRYDEEDDDESEY